MTINLKCPQCERQMPAIVIPGDGVRIENRECQCGIRWNVAVGASFINGEQQLDSVFYSKIPSHLC